MRLFDCHTHLDQFPHGEIADILNRANTEGVAAMILAGTTLSSSVKCVELAESDDRMFAGIGIHPMDIEKPVDSSTQESLITLASSPKVVAFSEIGLDGMNGMPNDKLQEDVFRSQIQLARECSLPIIYHSRMSYPRILDLLEEERAYEVGGAAHYFQGDLATAYRCIDLGFFISLARPLLRLPELQQVVHQLPLENMILETDSFPQPFKKRRESWTEPRHVAEIAKFVAYIQNMDVAEVADQTNKNVVSMLGQRASAIRNILIPSSN